MKQLKKVKTKREKAKYPALDPTLNLKTRWEEIMDIGEYFFDLPDEAKEWMNKFTEEFVCDKLNRKNLKKNLHNTKKLKKACDDKNNQRNRDVYTRAKARGSAVYIEDLNKKDSAILGLDEYENELNEVESKKLNE